MSRPEHVSPPELFYNEKEAAKYANSSRMVQIQSQISERAIELLNLPPHLQKSGGGLLLDIGCGTGMSGGVIEEHGHAWLGVDISEHMLQIAHAQLEDDDDDDEDDEDDEDDDDDADGEDAAMKSAKRKPRASMGGVALADMGNGLGFRPGSFDGAISISAVQWLCYASHKAHIPRLRLKRFFLSLYACLRRGSRAVLQLYPETPQQMELITNSAMSCGFTGGVVVDYPNSAKAKKFYLVLFAGSAPGGGTAGSKAMSMTSTSRGRSGAADPQPFHPGAGLHQSSSSSSTAGSVAYETDRRGFRGKKRGRRDNVKIKSKEWILAKKDRMKRQGKDVKTDSKFSGRRRRNGF